MKEDNVEMTRNQPTEISSVAKNNLPQQISETLNAFLDSRPDDFERLELEAEPVPAWRFKITLVSKRK